MIQRIQSVYLLLVTGLLIASMCLPVGSIIDFNGAANVFKPLGLMIGETFQSTWGLFGILMLAAIIAFATIFLFKNRILQIRMVIFNSLLLVGYYLAFLAFYFVLRSDDTSLQFHWALCFPLIAIILNYLAMRAIGRDEAMIHAADRLR